MELDGEGNLLPLGPAPDWLEAIRPWDLDHFVFLECVLPDLEPCWEGTEPSRGSGVWEQQSDQGMIPLEAYPVPSDGRRVLLLRNLGESYAEQVEILQKARDNALVHEALEAEIKKKEFLLHTVVHDLAGPLTSIKGALHILSRQGLPPDKAAELLKIGMRQCDRQERMIREILEVFAAEVDALNERKVDTRTDPDQACKHVVEALTAAYQDKGVDLIYQGAPCRVVGDDAKLERVVSNLAENALRNVPAGKKVEIVVTPGEADALIEVKDNGPGVPEEAAANLFQKMAKGKKGGGKIGLGLYFCKLTVQAWGGEIGYRPSDSGGACFWFRLPYGQG